MGEAATQPAMVRRLVDLGERRLAAAGIDTPRLDAELLLAHAAGARRTDVVAGLVKVECSAERYEQLLARREAREPVAYITGSKGFRRIELAVDRRVLIPRPETELLVELALAEEPPTLLDVATGSGAVALAVADESPHTSVLASDVSPDALAVAEANATALGLTGRVEFIQSDLLDAVDSEFAVITANLPYVAKADLATLQPEIARFEPQLALTGGADGLDLVRRLIATAPTRLAAGGLLALEIGMGQADVVAELLEQGWFTDVTRHEDLAGIERVVSGRRR